MTSFTLTTWFIAALSLPSLGQTQASLHSRISSKERQLAEIQKELHELRSRLSSPTVGKYSVRQGETLHSIARRNGVSVSSIIKWNKITDPAKLKVGEKIIISELLHSPISVPSPNRISSAGSADYVIASGDTFYSIARRHKMDLSELRALNPNVNIHLLSPGKKLRISGETPLDSRPAKRQEVLVAEKDVKSKIDQPALESPTRAEALKSIVASKSLPQPPMIEDRNISSTTTSIILTDVITFEAFASRHNTNTKLLNALNGWNLPRTTILAGGSEILVPN
ncbi:LysM peptidoglycan-binding domain-containing protein [Akkermansiaceae bacterium]|nr:LysM peptidoglycan-binding domain-containing protein [bacterium]MDB4398980.1 LysM peptidoglycan-binding domain-containing protein [Akkermansiaceae bacterium]MDB4358240.1 LysM peptidoglycan-binding domain-containing protein [bacterium]MDB4445037.1 LysM peptidoglycan-binding domain-containing protein [Akkermansiaceae bacterium]MDB4517824.1 LysM peptidoglycan-binding domain-containing protein [Akkermansiaceae bacterium]